MRLAITALVAAAVAALAPSAAAAPALDGTFTPTGTPGYIARGPDGNVWFALTNSSANKEFGRIAPDGTITEYDSPNNLAVKGVASGPSAAGGAHDFIWFTQEGAVTRWNPATATGTAHAIAGLMAPRDIAADRDGNMWAVALDHVVKIAPNGTKIADFLPNTGGRGITLGSDGRMYLADFGNAAVKAFTTADPTSPQTIATTTAPQEIEPGPEGQLAVSLPNSEIGRVSIQGTVEKTTDNASDPFGIAYGNDGAYWLALFTKHQVARLTPTGEYTQPITLPAGTGPRYIAAGANDTLWVTGETSGKIHRITGVSAPPKTEPEPENPPPPPDTTPPDLTDAKVSVRKRQLTISLSEAAALSVRIDVKRNGKRSGGTCKALKKGERTRKPCRYWKQVRIVTAAGVPGVNRVALGKALKPGTYRAVATGTDAAANVGGPVDAGFKVSP